MRHLQSFGARARTAILCSLVILVASAGLSLASPSQAQAHTVARGFADALTFNFSSWGDGQVKALHEIAAKLHAKYVRFDVYWRLAEPAEGVYAENADQTGYLDNVRKAVDAAQAQGLKVIIVTYEVPKWASDHRFWKNPNLFSGGKDRDGYCDYYAPTDAGIAAFGDFAQHLATLLAGKVMAYEAWNEPNLWVYLYPQTYGSDNAFAVHRYAAMLKAFHDGIKLADPSAQVVAGCTAPIGEPLSEMGRLRTSPQAFARALLKSSPNITSYFDAYDHHPYTPGGTRDMQPEAMPSDPTTTVQLANLATLLKLFPGKPFYLTEYGYNTAFSRVFGGGSVTQIQQAAYLKRAYAYAARYDQVKLMCWYQLKDWSPSGKATDGDGIYMGLRTLTGAAKRAWYAYAGGNRLTLNSPTSVRAGVSFKLYGRLTSTAVTNNGLPGGIGGRPLVVQACGLSTGWRTLTTVTTDSQGYYHVWLRTWATKRYRVAWQGVVTSLARRVLVS